MAESGPARAPSTTTGFHETGEVDGLYEMVVTVSTLRLGTLTGARDWWRFEPVPEGALVVLRRISEDQATPLQTARSGEDGLLYELDPEDKASRSSDVLLYLHAPERYLLWWTLDPERYLEMLDDPSLLETDGSLIEVMQKRPFHHPPLLEKLEAFDRQGTKFGERADVRKVICHHLLHRHAFHDSPASPIFDVTPACIRALFTVELMQWYVLKAHEASANHMATFHHAAAMIQAAEKGLKDITLEKRASKLFPTPSERRVFDYFRDYAWRCAATGIGKALFARSIAMHERSDLPPGGIPDGNGSDAGVPQRPAVWLEPALQIRRDSQHKKHGPAVHPHLQGISGPIRVLMPEAIVLHHEQQQLLVDYYDSYLFGATLRKTWIDGDEGFQGPTHYRGRMAARMDDWAQQTESVRQYARALLERDAHPDGFLSTLAGCYPDDEELMERYVDAASYCGLDWWRLLGEAERRSAPAMDAGGNFVAEEWPFWKAFKARLKPLAENAKASGKISKLLAERLAAYKLAVDALPQLLDTVGRLEVALAGGDVNAKRHVIRSERALVRVDAAGDSGEVRIAFSDARPPGAPKSVTLRFARETPTIHPHGVPDPPSGVTAARSYAAGFEARPPFQVEVPAGRESVRELSGYSKSFAVLAETLNLAIAVATLCGEAKAKDKALAFFDLAKGLVGVVESVPGALIAMSPALETSSLLEGLDTKIKNFKGVSTWFSRVDGVLKIYKGLEILFSDESDLQYELRQGRTFRAELQRYAGVANIVAGAASVAEVTAAGAAAAGATEILGCSTLLLAGFSATPWGLALTLGGSILVAGSALVLDMTQPWGEKILEVERALDAACRQEVRGTRLKVSTRLDEFLKLIA